MSYQALARKWRPRNFDAIVGQEHVVRALVNAFDRDRLHHAYLFSGTRGVGKTTIARVFAKGLNCEHGPTARPCCECGVCREIDEGRHIDLIEVDAASRARVEETRDLLDNVQYAPIRARFKVYLIDEVHMFSRHSFNALLKTLEEPPPHVKFLLATTDPQRLPVTVLSRCLQFGLRRLSVEEIGEELARIAREEAIEAAPPALRALGRAADGSMRDALSLLDQAAAYGAGRIVASDVRALLGTVDRDRLFALLEALASSDPAAMIETLDRAAGEAADFEILLADVIEALGRMAALQVAPAGREEDEEIDTLRAVAGRFSPEALQLYYQIGVMGRRDLPYAPHPRAGFEMTMLRMVAFAPAAAAAAVREQDAAVTGARVPEPAEASHPTEGTPPAHSGIDAQAPAPAAQAPAPAEQVPAPAAQAPAPAEQVPAPAAQAPAPAEQVPAPAAQEPAPAEQVPAPAAQAPASAEQAPLPAAQAPASAEQAPAPAAQEPAPAEQVPAPAAQVPAPAAQTPAPRETEGILSPSRWAELCARLALNGVTGQLAANCVVRRYTEKTVDLGLNPEHAQLLTPGTRAKLESALGDYLGRPIRLRVDIAPREQESPAERDARDEDERVERASRDLRDVPDYQDLLARFEGNTRSIQPPD